ncbi:hypothetical protein NDU88_004736 [Pleurodeles waltl]|uniref:Uncharacterized protein n=1 Tax=Pleurodeles waltl TaxID=8319 RepID=A0AAV7PKN8_PLEWA|nr:hypothetical protein NDU88_004736 [Pleurodeles waltl]
MDGSFKEVFSRSHLSLRAGIYGTYVVQCLISDLKTMYRSLDESSDISGFVDMIERQIAEGSCDGPLLPQADPPCSEGVDSAATSDLEVQPPSANPRSRPWNVGQREPFRAVTWLQNSDGSDERRSDGRGTLCWGTAKEDGDDKEGVVCSRWMIQQETLSTTGRPERVAREAPRACSGHAWGNAWPLQVRGLHK